MKKIGELIIGFICFLIGLGGPIYLFPEISLYQTIGFITFTSIGFFFIRLFLKSPKFKLATPHVFASGILIITMIPLSYIGFKAFLLKYNFSGLIVGLVGLFLLIYGLDLFYTFLKKIGLNRFFKRIKILVVGNWKKLLKIYIVVTVIFALALFGYIESGDGPPIRGVVILSMEVLILTWIFIAPLYNDLLK